MEILKILDREFHLYIDKIEELQDKIDSLIITSRFMGYKINNLYADREDKKESFFFTCDDEKHFLIEVHLDVDDGVDRIIWAVNNDTAGVKLSTWEGVLREELIESFDELISYI